MQAWLPIIGTLAGAVVAGAISVALMILSNRHSLRIAKLNFQEDRAKWAAERQLDRLQKFHSSLQRLVTAVEQFRIQQAWAADPLEDGTPAPKWVHSYDAARGEFEEAIRAINTDIALLDENVQAEYKRVRKHQFDWFCSKSEKEGVGVLCSMEQDLLKFRESLAQRHRNVFDSRRLGADLGSE